MIHRHSARLYLVNIDAIKSAVVVYNFKRVFMYSQPDVSTKVSLFSETRLYTLNNSKYKNSFFYYFNTLKIRMHVLIILFRKKAATPFNLGCSLLLTLSEILRIQYSFYQFPIF